MKTQLLRLRVAQEIIVAFRSAKVARRRYFRGAKGDYQRTLISRTTLSLAF
jgi:hypothetical protein